MTWQKGRWKAAACRPAGAFAAAWAGLLVRAVVAGGVFASWAGAGGGSSGMMWLDV